MSFWAGKLMERCMNLRPNFNTARLLAGIFSSLKEIGVADRRVFDGILKESLRSNPEYLGVWTVWEPNALDGRDAQYAHAPGHDSSGRYVPLWNRRRGDIEVVPNEYYDEPGLGDWYLLPRSRGVEAVMEPYEYPFAGQRMFITTQIAPIFFQGECVGAAGVDFAVDTLAGAQASHCEELLGRGYVFLDGRGEVTYWSERTRRIFAKYFPLEAEGRLPAQVRLQFRKALAEGRSISPQLFHLRNEGLLVRYIKHPLEERHLIVIEETGTAPAASLSEREREVLQWISRGKTNGEIAIILGISLHTVKRHVEKVLAKLGVENRHAAALSALQSEPVIGSMTMGQSAYLPEDATRLLAPA